MTNLVPTLPANIPFWHHDATTLDPEGAAIVEAAWQAMETASAHWQRSAMFDAPDQFKRLHAQGEAIAKEAASRSGMWSRLSRRVTGPGDLASRLDDLARSKQQWSDAAKLSIDNLRQGLNLHKELGAALPGAIARADSWKELALSKGAELDQQMGQSTDANDLLEMQALRQTFQRMEAASGLVKTRLMQEQIQLPVYRELFAKSLDEQVMGTQQMDAVLQARIDQISSTMLLDRVQSQGELLKQLPAVVAGQMATANKPLTLWGSDPMQAGLRKFRDWASPERQETVGFRRKLANGILKSNLPFTMKVGGAYGDTTVLQILLEQHVFGSGKLPSEMAAPLYDAFVRANPEGMQEILRGMALTKREEIYKAVGRHIRTDNQGAAVQRLAELDPTEGMAADMWGYVDHIFNNQKNWQMDQQHYSRIAKLCPLTADVFWAGRHSELPIPANNESWTLLNGVMLSPAVSDELKQGWVTNLWRRTMEDASRQDFIMDATICAASSVADPGAIFREALANMPGRTIEAQLGRMEQTVAAHPKITPRALSAWHDTRRLVEIAPTPDNGNLETLLGINAEGALWMLTGRSQGWEAYANPAADVANPLNQALTEGTDPQLIERLALRLPAWIEHADHRGTPVQFAAKNQDADCVRMFLQHGANWHWEGGNAFQCGSPKAISPEYAARVAWAIDPLPVDHIVGALSAGKTKILSCLIKQAELLKLEREGVVDTLNLPGTFSDLEMRAGLELQEVRSYGSAILRGCLTARGIELPEEAQKEIVVPDFDELRDAAAKDMVRMMEEKRIEKEREDRIAEERATAQLRKHMRMMMGR